MRDPLAVILDTYPEQREIIHYIRSLQAQVEAVDRHSLFEPLTLVEVIDEKQSLLSLTPQYIDAWRQHVANSTHVRMRCLEGGIFEEMANSRLLCAMAIVRAHMECAALAAFCEMALVDAAREKKWERLKEPIFSTLFGTFLLTSEMRVPKFEGTLLQGATTPIEIARAIEAMDRFVAASPASPQRYRQNYSFLSEYVQPTMRSNRCFVDIVEQTAEGWILRYNSDEKVTESDLLIGLEMVLDNMRVGYSCLEMLRRSKMVADEDNEGRLTPPTRKDLEQIWKDFLQRPI